MRIRWTVPAADDLEHQKLSSASSSALCGADRASNLSAYPFPEILT